MAEFPPLTKWRQDRFTEDAGEKCANTFSSWQLQQNPFVYFQLSMNRKIQRTQLEELAVLGKYLIIVDI